MKKQLLNIKEAGEYVGLSPNVIRDLIGKRKFPYKNVSRGEKAIFRFDVRELDKWIDELPGMNAEELLN
jgi:predicted DNA-binding transcriptional regulator AlpA